MAVASENQVNVEIAAFELGIVSAAAAAETAAHHLQHLEERHGSSSVST